MDLTLVPYQPHLSSPFFKYKECMRNHAASIGGHAHDGCGEFMPSSDHSLTCAACGCHRNFHRREGSHPLLLAPPPLHHHPHHQQQLSPYNAGAPAVPRKDSHHDFDDGDDDDQDRRSETPEREEAMNMEVGGRGPSSAAAKSKRFRMKFTAEQKEKMLEFAEKIGWRIHRHDDVALNEFCNEIGVKRNVLKVWMHNNKNAHRRRDTSAAVAAPPPAAPTQSVGV